MAKKTSKKVENPVESNAATVYIGPSIHGLAQYTIFKGGILPDYVKKIAAENKGILNRIVPVAELQTAREKYDAEINKKEV